MLPHSLRRVAVLLVFSVAAVVQFAADTPAPAGPQFARASDIPAEYFFRSSAISDPQLNAAGTHLAILAHDPKADSNSIVIVDLAKNSLAAARSSADLNIHSFRWLDDDTVVFSIVKERIYAWGLFAAHRDNPYNVIALNKRDVVEPLGVPRLRPRNLMYWLRDAGDRKDLGVFESEVPYEPPELGSRVRRHHWVRIPEGYDGVHRWLLDRDGELRYALAYKGAKTSLLRRNGPEKWETVSIDLNEDSPLAVDQDDHVILVAHRSANGRCELMRFNTKDGSRGPALHADDRYDFATADVNFSRDNEVIGLVYPQQAIQQLWLRESDERLQREIDATLPRDRINLVVSRSRDDQRVIVHSTSDRHPGTIYLFDRAKRTLARMGELAPQLPPQLMASVHLVSFQTRDGLSLEGYVTLPLNHTLGEPGPMVVLPHGGPWLRDCWGYDAESQFLASRGYIVFRPNYRGSSGYQPEISIEPSMDFRRMHDDVTDGVRSLIASKIADPKRIAIFGSSFGGYLAIAGAAFEPDLYRCAASFAGVFDLDSMMKDDRTNKNDYRYAHFRSDFGDSKENKELFDAMSPQRHVGKIKAAIFVAHGEEDRNADTGQSRRLVRALKSAGLRPETMFISGEAHGLASTKHRVEFYTRLEAFLKKHL